MSSIGSVAARIYTMQNKKGSTLTSAMSDVIKENLAVRFSVYNLVRTITKSELLATVAQTKYGRKTPQQKKEESAQMEQNKADLKFKQFTVSSIISLNRKITALTSITKRNTELITSLYNDIGAYRGKQVTNTNQVSSRLLRVPLKEKSIKGKIDKINADLDAMKEISKKLIKKRKEQERKKEPETKPKEDGGILSLVLEGLIKNPLLMAALTRGGGATALALARYGIPALSIAGIPNAYGNIATRLSGKSAYANPFQEKVSQTITPITGAIGTYSAGMLLTNAYNRLKPGMTKAESIALQNSAKITEQFGLDAQSRLKGKYKNLTSQRLSAAGDIGARAKSTVSNLDKMYQAKLQRVKTYAGMQRVLKEYDQARKKMYAVRELRSQLKNQVASKQGMFSQADMDKKIKDRIAKTMESKRRVALAKNALELQKWNKITSRITAFTKRIPAVTAAYVVYKISEMSNYVAQKSTGEMNKEEFKKNMTESYSDLASTLGSQGVGALIGGLVGTALFPGIGTATLAIAGGAIGMAAGLFMDDTGASHWLGEKLFQLFHEDKPYTPKKDREGFEITAAEGEAKPPTKPPPPPSVAGRTFTSGLQNDPRVQERTSGDPKFMEEVQRVSDRFQIDPSNLLAVMWSESRLEPTISNPKTDATGLIQFMPNTAKMFGTTTDALKKMSRAEQMKYVEKYFEFWKLPKGADIATIYSYVFMPALAQKMKKNDKGQVVLAFKGDKQHPKAYELNSGLDIDGDDVITTEEIGKVASKFIAPAQRAAAAISAAPAVASVTPNQVVAPPPTDTQEKDISSEGSSTQAQVAAVAALQSAARIQGQLNAVSTETIRLREKVKSQDEFPTTFNNDMTQYA